MITTTETDLIRDFHRYLNAVETQGEAIAIVRGNLEVARMIPGHSQQTAREVMQDLYGTLPEKAAKDWLNDSRIGSATIAELNNPWDI
ncbi:MAG: type II toxin-antitoxin system Phd/YefM family antitoxin [Proteobacteria bacterium]|nr:type II toxin-antitoxin system Phd/YefM family antitoxin [Pseudomonadota bacterium]